jgi:MFS transporter, FHS family, glucose/mannose:H+ symporter
MPRLSSSWPPAGGVIGCLAFVLIGWSGLLVPSLIRSVKDAFAQSDAGIGIFYFAFAAAYASGSLGGGLVIERLGRRTVLSLAAALHGSGLVAFALAPSWTVFLLVAIPAGLGAGAIDGGTNGMFLDLFRSGRGRALNLLHLFFSLGALSAPLAVGRLVESGVAWQAILLTTGAFGIVVAVLFLVVAVPHGRQARVAAESASELGLLERARGRLAAPLLLLGFAIACYVASEVGVSSWLVRFLEPAPLTAATTALSLYWAGLALGRLVSARLADRFDHVRFATVSTAAMSVALFGAILAPSLSISVALFALAGFASGPVFPMIIAIGGDRYPDRSAAVGGFLTSAAVVGSVVYPPIMGLLSVTSGLTVAMLGTALLGLACVAALILVGRMRLGASGAASLGRLVP